VPLNSFRLVLDTNVLVRGFINSGSDSGRILQLCEQRRAVTLLSSAVLREYRFILADTKLCARYPQLEQPEIAVAIERLIYVSDLYRRVGVRFDYPRDPKDSHLIELAIAGAATHLISTDDDLVSLPNGRTEAAKRFRQRLPVIEVVSPYDFLRLHREKLRLT